MSNEYDEIELQLWIQGITEQIAKMDLLLSANPPELGSISSSKIVLQSQVNELVRLKPKKKTDYDYKPAIPLIVQAKQLITKAEILSPPESVYRDAEQRSSPSPSIARRIPEIKITTFDGDIIKYSTFISSFDMKFRDLPIEDREKLQHLKECTSGNTLKLIERYELTNENYRRARDKLDQTFTSNEDTISILYQRLRALPTTASSTDASLQSTFYEVESLLGAMEASGQNLDSFAPLRDEVYMKYPAWLVHQACGKKRLNIREFQNEVNEHIRIRASIHATTSNTRAKPSATMATLTTNTTTPKQQKNSAATPNTKSKPPETTKRTPTCVFCEQQHYSAECTTYKTAATRKPRMTDRCSICLAKEHVTNACTREIRCYYCKKVKDHHSCICPQQFGFTEVTPPPLKTTPNATAAMRTSAFVQRQNGAHCTALLTLTNPQNERKFRVRALFDSGSNESYIAESAARRMGLEFSSFKVIPVNVFHQERPVKFKSAVTTFTITNDDGFQLDVIADTASQLPQEVQLFDMAEFLLEYPEFRETTFVEQGAAHPIELLIGSDYFYDIMIANQRTRVAEGLYTIATPFGSLLVGRQRDRNNDRAIFYQLSPQKAVEKLCSLDVIGIAEVPLSVVHEEELALAQFYKNIEFSDGRYEIRLPWKQFPPRVADNFGAAIGRLRVILRKFDDATFNEYRNIIDQQIEAGVVEEIAAPPNDGQIRYYLPHHPVFTPEKSTATRIVFDGSAKSQNGKSLNDAIYKGVNLLTSGVAILIRFRLHRTAIASDIEKAFHQLRAHTEDRRFLMFLFVHDRSKPATGANLRFLRFMRYVFGIVASPFVLQATIKHRLRRFKNEFTQQIEEDIYVDGIITGFDDAQQAARFYTTSCALFATCKMNLRKWASNDAKLRDLFTQPDKSPAISILGLLWDQYEDNLRIKPMTPPDTANATLRSVLSKIAQFYDPCGYFASVMTSAKILVRELHSAYAWDDKLTEDHRISGRKRFWNSKKQPTSYWNGSNVK